MEEYVTAYLDWTLISFAFHFVFFAVVYSVFYCVHSIKMIK